jgi:predicted nucleic acid-binding protein
LILVDTSVLLDFLAGRETEPATYLERLIRQEAAFYLSPEVVQEVLQGARNADEWETLHQYLSSQMWVGVRDPWHSHVEAARIYFDCRRKGLTVRSTADCVIAQIALEQEYALLHDDRDFEAIAKVRALATLP